MNLSLNIYQKGEIEKTYQTDTLHILFGTVEDFINILDMDNIDDEKEVAKMIVKGIAYLKPLLKDIFPGITDEEIRRVNIKELIVLFVDLFHFAGKEIAALQTQKNR